MTTKVTNLNIDTTTITEVGNLTTLTVSCNILPSANVTYDLGSPTHSFRDLYLSGSTIYFGGASITTDVTSGAVTIVPSPTVAEPNPSGLVITTAGTLSVVQTTAGEVSVGDLSNSVSNSTPLGTISSIDLDGNASNILYGNGVFAAAPSGGGTSVTVDSTPPNSPTSGSLWYDDTTTGELYVYASNAWITTSIVPMTTVTDPLVTGPSQANEVSTQTFTITNYNASYAYIISVTGGTYTRTAGSIAWTLPAVTSNTTHYMTTQVVSGGVTSSVDTRTVSVINLNIDDTAVIVTDFSYNNYNSGWTI